MDSITYGQLWRDAKNSGEKFSIFDFKPKKMTQLKKDYYYFMKDKKMSRFYRKKRRWLLKLRKHLTSRLSSIKSRCISPGCNGYKYYGGRGIKCFIILDELEFLWHRDNASEMEHPSIDRIDNDGNYELSNCRFIEWADNNKRRIFKNKKVLTNIKP